MREVRKAMREGCKGVMFSLCSPFKFSWHVVLLCIHFMALAFFLLRVQPLSPCLGISFTMPHSEKLKGRSQFFSLDAPNRIRH